MPFEIVSEFVPQGDQPAAIEFLGEGLATGNRHQTLLGVTGSGKTFTMAHLVQTSQRPTIVIAPNKILAAQLYQEFRDLFPNNAIEYFVSYYDYYQPEAYVPTSDTYIEKDARINEKIDRMRNSATRSLFERRDVLIVASVSCIYGLGSPQFYGELSVPLAVGKQVDRDDVLRDLTFIQYQRNNLDLQPGTFRARGDVVEVFPIYEESRLVRIEFFGDEIEAISLVDPLTGEVLGDVQEVTIYPRSHYVTPKESLDQACETIAAELEEQLVTLRRHGQLLEAQRLEQRTNFDLEMIREMGFCSGIENYSRHLDGRPAGAAPATLLNYFPEDYLILIDESHVTMSQLRAMYKGDQSRKRTLVDYGFRLPSALDNRPLSFPEFEKLVNQIIFVSATPSSYELEHSVDRIAEQVVRPTGLIDPEIEVRAASGQVDDLLGVIRERVADGDRVLVTTLTKRMAEELTDYYRDLGVRVKYMHSDIDAMERSQIVRDLRLGTYDVLVGINLLREGLDLPEVSLVAILDADKEGFLRSKTSLIQTCGRAARNLRGKVIMYADRVTDSMRAALDETERRRLLQTEYNVTHGITPETVRKTIHEMLSSIYEKDYAVLPGADEVAAEPLPAPDEIPAKIESLRLEMKGAADELDYERAATLRDEIFRLEKLELEVR